MPGRRGISQLWVKLRTLFRIDSSEEAHRAQPRVPRRNRAEWSAWLDRLAEVRHRSLEMGGAEKVERLMHAQGKLDARQRIEALFDPGSFVELGGLVGNKVRPSRRRLRVRRGSRKRSASARGRRGLHNPRGFERRRWQLQALPAGRARRPGGPTAGVDARRRRRAHGRPHGHARPHARRSRADGRREGRSARGLLGVRGLGWPRGARRAALGFRRDDAGRVHVHGRPAAGEGGARSGSDEEELAARTCACAKRAACTTSSPTTRPRSKRRART